LNRWIPVRECLPPEGVEVETRIFVDGDERNVQTLVRRGRLWFFPGLSMYCYYQPTHWRELDRQETK